MSLIPVSVLTGFLGAGKTTLLNRLMQRPELANTAVIINEFGEIGIDHLLVARSDENVVEMASGCLCCTIRGDLIETFDDLLARRDAGAIKTFDRVVIETTGLADPAPILHTLMSDPKLFRRIALDSVVTMVDAVTGDATLDRHPEAVKQAAVADRIVLTKTDLAQDAISGRDVEKLKARLRALNPAAPILTVERGAVDPARLFDAGVYDPTTKHPDVLGWLQAEAYLDPHGHHHHGHDDHDHAPGRPGQDAHDVNRHDARIRAYCIVRDQPISAQAFNLFVEILTANAGENLLRVKGILNLAEAPGTPVIVHGVQHLFHPVEFLQAWPSADHRSRLVFITRDIPRDHIERLLDGLNTAA